MKLFKSSKQSGGSSLEEREREHAHQDVQDVHVVTSSTSPSKTPGGALKKLNCFAATKPMDDAYPIFNSDGGGGIRDQPSSPLNLSSGSGNKYSDYYEHKLWEMKAQDKSTTETAAASSPSSTIFDPYTSTTWTYIPADDNVASSASSGSAGDSDETEKAAGASGEIKSPSDLVSLDLPRFPSTVSTPPRSLLSEGVLPRKTTIKPRNFLDDADSQATPSVMVSISRERSASSGKSSFGSNSSSKQEEKAAEVPIEARWKPSHAVKIYETTTTAPPTELTSSFRSSSFRSSSRPPRVPSKIVTPLSTREVSGLIWSGGDEEVVPELQATSPNTSASSDEELLQDPAAKRLLNNSLCDVSDDEDGQAGVLHVGHDGNNQIVVQRLPSTPRRFVFDDSQEESQLDSTTPARSSSSSKNSKQLLKSARQKSLQRFERNRSNTSTSTRSSTLYSGDGASSLGYSSTNSSVFSNLTNSKNKNSKSSRSISSRRSRSKHNGKDYDHEEDGLLSGIEQDLSFLKRTLLTKGLSAACQCSGGNAADYDVDDEETFFGTYSVSTMSYR